MKKVLGWSLLASPFIGIAILTTHMHGPLFTLGVFGASAGIAAVIVLGVYLAFG